MTCFPAIHKSFFGDGSLTLLSIKQKHYITNNYRCIEKSHFQGEYV